jgi:hypothetical protein
MFVCLQEFIVEEYFPLFMEYLSVAMSHKNTVRALAIHIFNCELLEWLWKLEWMDRISTMYQYTVKKKLTAWKYAMWLHKWQEGFPRQYLESFPKYI